MPLPRKNHAYDFPIRVIDRLNPGSYKINPTIASGDFKISIDFGAFVNLATLPVLEPAGGSSIKISLSDAEMNGDKIQIEGVDAVGDEWADVLAFIDTPLVTEDEIFSAIIEDAQVEVQLDGSRIITFFEVDGVTILAKTQISEDNETRTRLQ